MFALYRSKYPDGQYETVFDFVKGAYVGKGMETIVDVWREPEVFMRGTWKELADGKWEGIKYRFVNGVHPHEAKSFTLIVESEILTVLSHPSCVGLGKIGLDYHYTRSCCQTSSNSVRPSATGSH
ncbi:uncharacterized protein BT62DRAFT_632202 [Guyanagaster necrorhizus]|uniref:Uncharacterized protein n=1 Tax=Guyanagaster necrorhizus TaxID=856835 RepID=A0A9P8ALW2_9AGAR|nr:uncharacterized protein BT62DRAFT_632202 [Guyanagaster necrorhizus MCA 3950]KAG7440225.1 hypothetical protein BT62DRAFT_632202 [Guyanagaster necrorhizus MCA 3950]